MLEDGKTYEGEGFGYESNTLCEVVFNSAMCGYSELLTDPSYAGQGVVMTYPIMGSYGICYEDSESVKPWLSAFIVRTVSGTASNFRCDTDLHNYLLNNKVPGICISDTRALTKHLREAGTMRGMIAYGEQIDTAAMKASIDSFSLSSYVPTVSSQEKKVYEGGNVKIALLDYGVKQNIIRSLNQRGCTVKSFPYDATLEELLSFNPDGIMLSNGPGDPKECVKSIAELKRVYEYGIPTFAICLGHQLMALALGFDTFKLKYGHRGINHPVKDLSDGRAYITSQNHGYVVSADTVNPSVADISFTSLNDGSIEGLTYKSGKVFSVQFHPEASPGPHDTGYLFDRFMHVIGGGRI